MVRLVPDVVSPVGDDAITRVQFVPSAERLMLMPIDRGPPPGPTKRPETMTYNTAASTTVMATIRMVAITGDTACSSFRMMAFMVLSFLRLSPPGGGGGSRGETFRGDFFVLSSTL